MYSKLVPFLAWGIEFIRKRPLSSLAIALSVLIIGYEIIQIFAGNLYLKAFNYADGTTLIMIGLLVAYGVLALRYRTDFQAVAFSYLNVLSFLLAYEAIFKWSFYLIPFRRYPVPEPELRLLLIETGGALSALAGLAGGYFAIKRWTLIWLGIFVILWAVWLLIGFPQLTGQVMYAQVIRASLSYPLIYAINRSTKAALFFAYITLFPGIKNVGA